MKKKVVEALGKRGGDERHHRVKVISRFIDENLEDFVTANTLMFFIILVMTKNFLILVDSKCWKQNEEFQHEKQCAENTEVINYSDETGVKLLQYKI